LATPYAKPLNETYSVFNVVDFDFFFFFTSCSFYASAGAGGTVFPSVGCYGGYCPSFGASLGASLVSTGTNTSS